VLKILNGCEHIDRNICFFDKEDRKTTGHEATLAKEQCTLDIRSSNFHKEQYMNGTDYHIIVWMLVVSIYLKLNLHIPQKGGVHLDRWVGRSRASLCTCRLQLTL